MVSRFSPLGDKIRELVNEELRRDPEQEFTRLYVEDGVYNFYLQDEHFNWTKCNYDMGAAVSVLPKDSGFASRIELCPVEDIKMENVEMTPTQLGSGQGAGSPAPLADVPSPGFLGAGSPAREPDAGAPVDDGRH